MYPDTEITDYLASNEVEFFEVFHKLVLRTDSNLNK